MEDRVFDLLPYEFPYMSKEITVRQLLSHTSGIYDYFDEDVVEDFSQLFDKVPFHNILGPKDMLPVLVEGKAYFMPGEKFKYCNSGFVILGMLIEVISGLSYGDYILREVCEPLNLSRTGCYSSHKLPKNCAYGYFKDDRDEWCSNIFEIPIASTADGGIFTTADDIVRMWKGVLSNSFLNKELTAEIFSIQAKVNEGNCRSLHYGLGFWIECSSEGDISNYYLTGGDPGVCFISKNFINQDLIITILGNTSDDAEILLSKILPFVD